MISYIKSQLTVFTIALTGIWCSIMRYMYYDVKNI